MKIVILGKIENQEEFDLAATMIRSEGNIPINPSKVMYALPYDISNADFYAVLIELVRISDAVYLLPDWEQDLGARIAKNNAENLGREVIVGYGKV